MRKILVLGATSAIVAEALKCFADDGDAFFLVARNFEKLEAIEADLLVRGASQVVLEKMDLSDSSKHADLITKAESVLSGLDGVLIGYGILGDQQSAESDFNEAKLVLNTNLVSVVSWLTLLANLFEKNRSGIIAVLGSVAGDRGRAVNYVYGTSKGALEIFLSGLRNRLAKKGVSVVTIKPGFVDTPMTAHLPHGALYADATTVGRGVYQAFCKRKNVVFLPWFWRIIMGVIRLIPEGLFKRMRI